MITLKQTSFIVQIFLHNKHPLFMHIHDFKYDFFLKYNHSPNVTCIAYESFCAYNGEEQFEAQPENIFPISHQTDLNIKEITNHIQNHIDQQFKLLHEDGILPACYLCNIHVSLPDNNQKVTLSFN